jgi:hypothetical protein
MDKRLTDWLESEDIAGNFHLRASIFLPSVAFERAGTSVSARVIIIDKSELPLSELGEMIIDLRKVETVKELFDRLEHRAVPGRPEKPAEPEPAPEREPKPATVGGYAPDPEADRQPLSPEDKALTAERWKNCARSASRSTTSTSCPRRRRTATSRRPTSLTPRPVSRFTSRKRRATCRRTSSPRHEPARSSSAATIPASSGAGAMPGFHFKTPEARDAFIGGTPNEALGAARPFKAVTAVYKDDVERVARGNRPDRERFVPDASTPCLADDGSRDAGP